MMTGLLRPTEGKILINDYDIVREPIKAKSILGYVPDKAFLYEKLKGREFLKFIASIHGIEKLTDIRDKRDRGRIDRKLFTGYEAETFISVSPDT
jgi:ABC-type multidrug transport system ATPase subunit